MTNARAAKAKGRTGQNEIVKLLKEAFPQLREGDILGRTMGDGGEDIILSPAAKDLIPLAIEVKRRKSGLKTIYDWVDQASAHVKTTEMPVVFCRTDRNKWLAIVPADDYIELLKENNNE